MQLKGKKVAVLGMGASGVAAVSLCQQHGAQVYAYDQRPRALLSAEAQALKVPVVSSLQDDLLQEAELVVLSPGIPIGPEIDCWEKRGVPVVGELELAASFLSCLICAIGGTNGKSTTTGLVGAIATAAGQKVFCGGNLGTPLSCAVGEGFELAVVEVSSFQLERAPTFRPDVSVLLNISEDHLDRHGTLQAYADCKGHAFVNQTTKDTAIGPINDSMVASQMSRGAARQWRFGSKGDYVTLPDSVVEAATGESFSLDDGQLAGAHNALNTAAAIAATRALGIAWPDIRRGLARYQPLPHRRVLVTTWRGVKYYDDSKATNVGAAAAAVTGLAEKRLVLIAGGKDKGGSYQALRGALEARARAVILIGEAAELMARELDGPWPVLRVASLKAAVQTAAQLAVAGDAVLLSPACASFDMFRSYVDRGRKFSEAVFQLDENEENLNGA